MNGCGSSSRCRDEPESKALIFFLQTTDLPFGIVTVEELEKLIEDSPALPASGLWDSEYGIAMPDDRAPNRFGD